MPKIKPEKELREIGVRRENRTRDENTIFASGTAMSLTVLEPFVIGVYT